jgi:hypothetical protein
MAFFADFGGGKCIQCGLTKVTGKDGHRPWAVRRKYSDQAAGVAAGESGERILG